MDTNPNQFTSASASLSNDRQVMDSDTKSPASGLPKELLLKIWKYSRPSARIVEIYQDEFLWHELQVSATPFNGNLSCPKQWYTARTPRSNNLLIPSAASTDGLARQEILRDHKLCFENQLKKPILFDTSKDILKFWHPATLQKFAYSGDGLRGMTRIALQVSASYGPMLVVYILYSVLSKYESLKDIVLILDEKTTKPWRSGRRAPYIEELRRVMDNEHMSRQMPRSQERIAPNYTWYQYRFTVIEWEERDPFADLRRTPTFDI